MIEKILTYVTNNSTGIGKLNELFENQDVTLKQIMDKLSELEAKELDTEGFKELIKATNELKVLIESKKEGVPTDASVAAILDAIKPLLPTPHKITFD